MGGIGFSPDEIAACIQRQGLLSLEINLALPGTCQCAACTSGPDGPQRILSLEEIRDLLAQAREQGARRCLLIDSEPVSHPLLPQIIDDIRCRGMQADLFTDGAAITVATAQFLREREVAVVLKINSLNRDLQNRLAGDGHAYDANFTAIDLLKRTGYGEPGGLRLAIRIEVCDENLDEIPTMWRWVRSQRMEPYIQIITPRQNNGQQPKFVAARRATQLFEEVGRIDEMEFDRKWEAPPRLAGRSCKRHLFACHVTPCGTIFACVGVTIPLGNIRTERLKEILNLSEVLENLRAFGQNVKEPCLSCCKTTDCYGCRGAAYQLTGDYLAGDQLCWKADGVEIESLPFAIDNLVPHGRSVRMIDQLVQIGERAARTEFTVRDDSVLVDGSGRLDELAYAEMIAQTFAASHGFHLSAEDRKVHRGFMLGIKNLVISGEAGTGDRLTVDVRKITRFGAFGVIEGNVNHLDGRLIAAGEIKIWRPNADFFQTAKP